MTDTWIENYQNAETLNEKYGLLRDEMTKIRRRAVRSVKKQRFAPGEVWYDPNEVAQTIAELDDEVEGRLVVFAANDFGLPRAFRPTDLERDVQEEIRQELLNEKYSDKHQDLDAIRQELLAEHPAIHKAIVAEWSEDGIRYHLPEGSSPDTNFLTVRETVGLIDWTTNSYQAEDVSKTF